MKRIPFVFVFALLALSLLLPAQNAQAQGPMLLPVTMLGTVAYNGVGMAGVTVKLCSPNCAADPAPISYVTGPGGAFVATSMYPTGGVIEVQPMDGYTFSSCPVPPALPTPQSLPCSIGAYGTRKLSGRALWSGTSNPAPNILVSLVPPDGHALPPVANALTDANGYYSLGSETAFDDKGLEPVEYTVKFDPPDYAYLPVSGGKVDLSGGSRDYSFAVSHSANLMVGVSVAGAGGPVAGVTLTLTGPDGSTSTQISSDSVYLPFNSLMENMKYTVKASAPAGWEMVGASSITIAKMSSPMAQVDFTAAPLPYISGKLLNMPVSTPPAMPPMLLVVLQNTDGTVFEMASPRPDGSFYFTNHGLGIPDGQYYVTVNPLNMAPGIYYAAPVPVTIHGASKKGLAITVNPYQVVVRGLLTTQSGLTPNAAVGAETVAGIPVAGATVKAERCDMMLTTCKLYATATSDATGFYQLKLATTDQYSYRVTVSKAGYQFFNQSSLTPEIVIPMLFLQQYAPPSSSPNPNFIAYKAYTVSGKVSNGLGGAGLPGVTVTATTTYNMSTMTRTAVSKADGTYTIKNVPDVGQTVVTAGPLLTVPFPQVAILSTVNSNQTGVNFFSAKKFYSVSGIATLNGLPLSGVNLMLLSSDPASLPTTPPLVTGADGKFKYPLLVEGYDYTLSFYKFGYHFTGAVTSYPPPPDLVPILALSSNKSVKVTATLIPRVVNVNFLAMPGAKATAQYRQLPGGAWKTISLTAGTPTPLSLYRAYAYEFKPAAANFLFDPAVVTLPADASTEVNLGGIPGAKLSGKITVLGKAVSGVKITPNWLSLPAAATTNTYGKYSLLLPLGPQPLLTLTHKYFTFPQWLGPMMSEDKANFDNTQGAAVQVKGRVIRSNGQGLGGVKLCASPTVCTTTNAQGYYYLPVAWDSGVNLWAFTLKPKLAGKTFSPSLRPVSPAYGALNKNFVAYP